jgi:hypothetical protein
MAIRSNRKDSNKPSSNVCGNVVAEYCHDLNVPAVASQPVPLTVLNYWRNITLVTLW